MPGSLQLSTQFACMCERERENDCVLQTEKKTVASPQLLLHRLFFPLPIMLDLTKYSSSRYCMPFQIYYILEFAPHKLYIVCVYSQI